LGTRIAKRARFGNAPTVFRCGEPLQLQLSGFLARNQADVPAVRQSMAVLANWVIM
jgi:hypothetical protein